MSALERKLNAGQFVVTAEMPVIDGGGQAEILRQLEPMQAYVDAFNATDNPAAHAHCSPLAVSIGLRNAGVEPIMQLVCRDRNRLALQSDLVGASMFGIENISCLTGDDVTAGDEPETRRVFDVDSVQLVAIARSLASGRYLSGRAISPAPHFFVGAVENPGAPPMDYRVRRAAKKALAGARFLQLQICYRTELLERFMQEAHDNGLTERIAMIPSICILRTVGGVRFVATRVPGIDVPATTVARVERAGRPGGRVLRDRLRARHPCPRSARRRRAPLHLVPQGRRHREVVPAARDRPTNRKGDQWTQCFARAQLA